jgi:hypothetical protein
MNAEPKKKRRASRAKRRTGVCTSPECEEFALLLTEYWENSEDQTLRREIEEHVKSCPSCAEVLRGYSIAVETFRSADKVSEPGTTHRELWDRLSAQLSALREYLN